MKQDAFTATPPTITIRGERVTLRPWNHGFVRMVNAVSALAENEEQKGAAIIIGFAVVNSLTPAGAAALLADPSKLEMEINIADQELSLEDIAAISNYLEEASTRQQEATVTVDGRAGKEQAGETRPAT